jgi:hypothetical protein
MKRRLSEKGCADGYADDDDSVSGSGQWEREGEGEASVGSGGEERGA